MAAGSIVVDLLMRTGSFETDTARAAKSLKKLQREAEAIGKAFGVAIVGAAATLTYLVKSTIDANDHLNDLSQQTGIAADTLGGIGFAASQAGLDLDTAAKAAGKLNKSLAEAAAGNKEAKAAFDAMGISVKDAAGNTKNADVVLAEIADKFKTYADGPEKAALALRIFGKAGAEMIPTLNAGGDALREQIDYFKKYSGVTADSAKDADEFNDTIGQLKLVAGSFSQALTSALLPALQSIAALFLKSAEDGDALRTTADRIADSFKALAVFVAFVGTTFIETGRQLGAFMAQAAALARLDFSGFAAIGKEAQNDLSNTRRDFQAFYDAIYAGRQKALAPVGAPTAAGGQQQAPRIPGSGNAKADVAAKRAASERLKLAEFAAEQQLKLEEITAQETAEAWSFVNKSVLKGYDDRIAAAAKQQEQYLENIDAVREREDEAARAVADAIETKTSSLDEFAKNAAENIQRSFGDTLVAAMDGNWRSIGDGFRQMLNRMVAEALSANIVRALFGADTKGNVTGTGGLFGELLKAFGSSVGGFASGGSPPVGRPSLVGERGPELFVPRTAGTIIPAAQTARIGGGVVVNQVIHVTTTGPGDRRSMAQLQADIGIATQRAIARNT